ncbi:sucrose-6-phosphate hydrolase SacC (GH32 family) [Haloferula luteola]|uniref:Sucrose-6-phosphate hydrolase SacC (GH32 family) n=1 Tax=Haloferula luteola TaxID=595692 RepID=A0A840V973_9BACT|nr:glycoside hydrolase family 43 protein [Haloferula luteola]MBB5351258.1 sucrose-6-phosphate hydrolase SacC (GH32 family) [Haloferula luteola]
MKRFLAMAALWVTPLLAEDGGYLFTTFKGEQDPMTEQIYFGLSRDGRDWKALNSGNPVLISQLGEKGVRDPYILRSHDGKKTWVIATDLSIHLTHHNWGRAVTQGSKSIVVWETEDLVNWSEPWMVKVAPDDAGCTWAPEAIYDEKEKDYLVFWASKTGRDEFKKHRIWAARTKDFKEFGEPFIYIEERRDIIDTDIVYENGTYYRFSKDETTKAITMEESTELMGRWKKVNGFSLKHLEGYEGPACFQIEAGAPGKPGKWCLLLDYYSKGQGYQPYVTDNLEKGKFAKADDIRFPFHFRHGSVLPVTEDEYQKLAEKYSLQD